jgi:apolipoprotein N-acyltransferase
MRRRHWLYLWATMAVPVIYGASFPLGRVWWLGWIGFIPWFVAVRLARAPGALLICLVATFLGSYACTPWLPRAVAVYYQQPLVLGVLLFAGVYAVTVGPYVVAFTLVFRALARRPSRWLPLLTGLAWAGAELARARLLVGDPFGIFGYSQIEMTPLVQIADITGVYGVTVMPLAFSAAWAEVWLAYALAAAAPEAGLCLPIAQLSLPSHSSGGLNKQGPPARAPGTLAQPAQAGFVCGAPDLGRRGSGAIGGQSPEAGEGTNADAARSAGKRWRPAVAAVAQAWHGLALVVAVVVAVVAYGLVCMRAWNPTDTGTRVAVIQGNLDLGSQWRQEFYGRNLEQYMRLTLEALREHRPQVVFWPESSMTFFLDDEPLYRAAIGHLLSASGTQLLAGGPRSVGEPPNYFNTGFLIAPDGQITAAYDKQRLLPFAEYFPFGGIEMLRREFARVREFTPGGAAQLLPTAAGKAGVVICNEVMFGEMVTDRVRAGAEYLVTLTNDSWLGDRKYAEEAFDMARLRAVEQRRYLVRASTSGPSAIVDPLGRVVKRTGYDLAGTLGGVIQASSTLTVYARVGDLFGMLCVVLPLGVLAGRWTRRRTTPDLR